MKPILTLLSLLTFAVTNIFAQTDDNKKVEQWSKYDFVPGDKIIFQDDFANEKPGEFPSKWKLEKGTAENAVFDGSNVLSFTTSVTFISPLMKKAAYLPEIFTIEFDVYFYNKYNEAYYVEFDEIGKLDIRLNKFSIKGFSAVNNPAIKAGWHHIAIAFNQRAFKAYFDEQRILNIPEVAGKPTRFRLSALSHGAAKGDFAIIKNVKIAEGGMDLYKRVTTDGKIITRGILFDVNKSTIKPESMGVINEIVKLMQDHQDLKFSVEGHTDSDGDDASNQTLSGKRAEAVKNALIKAGISADRLSSKGLGESKPIDNNGTPEGKANNRRVEFIKL